MSNFKTKVLNQMKNKHMVQFEATSLKPVLQKIQLILQLSFLYTISDYEKEPKPVSSDMLSETVELNL